MACIITTDISRLPAGWSWLSDFLRRLIMILWRRYPQNIGERWVFNGHYLFVVVKCQRFLWWYRITLERGTFKEGEF